MGVTCFTSKRLPSHNTLGNQSQKVEMHAALKIWDAYLKVLPIAIAPYTEDLPSMFLGKAPSHPLVNHVAWSTYCGFLGGKSIIFAAHSARTRPQEVSVACNALHRFQVRGDKPSAPPTMQISPLSWSLGYEDCHWFWRPAVGQTVSPQTHFHFIIS